ncbi:MAG: magnesium chelatase [Acidobacteria bacterium]|nr:magnesium chelatase [Acidobacteriota bacterium]
MKQPDTLGQLKASGYQTRCVKDEMRANLIQRLKERPAGLFEGILGYEETVEPQIINAILSRHNFILLGLRGQAKSRILRSLISFLDPEIPVVLGCEIHDSPYQPLCRSCHERFEELGDDLPVAWMPRALRYVEKLATPDVTIADMIGDIDPIRAAKEGRTLGDELTIHYGLLPRANRGIFAINELPDLAAKIQVGLFNIMQEGDVQIKGYPVRLPLDLLMVFSANPEDYTARGKIITPLKDRIGSEIKTHYPATVRDGVAITKQEAWTDRQSGLHVRVPPFIHDIVEQAAFLARTDQRIDKRSGVSQRMPISCMENVISNAERRALLNNEKTAVARLGDIYSALPAITGKMELEYEGELRGAENIARELIRESVLRVLPEYFPGVDARQIVDFFELGGTLKLDSMLSDKSALKELKKIQGLLEKASSIRLKLAEDGYPVAAAEFLLEGLYAQKKISRTEEQGYRRMEGKKEERFYGESERVKKPFN